MNENESLLERRLLPRADRELFQYEIVRFHLEDLNALAERRAARARPRASRPARAEPAQDRARVAAIVRAARWDRAGFLRAIRRFVDEGRAGDGDGDCDGFGPALLLLALGRANDPFLTGVAPSVRKLAAAALEEIDLGDVRARTSPKKKAPRRRRTEPR